MDTFEGRILWRSSIAKLGSGGKALADIIEQAYSEAGLPKEEPVIVPCWSSMLDLPLIDPIRAVPLLVIRVPDKCAGDLMALLTNPLTLMVVSGAYWARRVTCLALMGELNTVQMRVEHILPVLRMLANDHVHIVAVCREDVTMVEHKFGRQEFLQVCAELRQDRLTADVSPLGAHPQPNEQYLCTRSDARSSWLPLVVMIDHYEEFSYGAVRSQEPDYV